MPRDIQIPVVPRRSIAYSDVVRINVRHYEPLRQLADEGGYASLGQLLSAILDAVLPRVELVERPRFDIVIRDQREED